MCVSQVSKLRLEVSCREHASMHQVAVEKARAARAEEVRWLDHGARLNRNLTVWVFGYNGFAPIPPCPLPIISAGSDVFVAETRAHFFARVLSPHMHPLSTRASVCFLGKWTR